MAETQEPKAESKQPKIMGTELTMEDGEVKMKPKEMDLPADFTFDNQGNIVKNNRKNHRNFKSLWRSVMEHKTSHVKRVTPNGQLENIPKLRYFTQHPSTKQEIRKRRKAERQNRAK